MSAWVMFAAAAALGLACTAVFRAVAGRVGLVDKPDGRRKEQAQPVALAGGLGVLLGGLLALLVVAAASTEVAAVLLADPARAASLAAAATVIALVGMVDDALNLRARHKLVGQMVAILILILGGGYLIEEVTVFGWHLPLGVGLGVPVTVFWFLAAVNAINLLDGMDGLLGTVGLLVCGTLAAIAFAASQPFAGWVGTAMAGALLGFLWFNYPPASVYLGDCGSMLIGLVVGALSISANLKGPAVGIMVPACLLVLPLMDTTAAVVRRKLTGRGLAQADRAHLHHVLQKRGWTRPRVLVVVAVLGGLAGGGALVSTYQNNDYVALAAAGAVVLILITTGLFGTAEVRLVQERAKAAVRGAVGRGHPVELSVRLQGSADWAGVWAKLVLAADALDLLQLRLDVNAPAWHEQYHGRWDRRAVPAPSELDVWRLELPVFGHGQVIGRLSVAGVRESAPVSELLGGLSAVLVEAERAAACELPAKAPPSAAPRPRLLPQAV
jgi:UDP-GlcNAc:undecaprenyl-phosphate GlcNAc-1-phosphate transferase